MVYYIACLFLILYLVYSNKCEHRWRIVKTSDVYEFDEDGHPKVLCLLQCSKCDAYKLQFVKVPPGYVGVMPRHRMVWRNAKDDIEVGGLHV